MCLCNLAQEEKPSAQSSKPDAPIANTRTIESRIGFHRAVTLEMLLQHIRNNATREFANTRKLQ